MAERLAGGNVAVALLANTGATVAVLGTLIALLGPLSGAHFNPAVSVVEALRGRLSWRDSIAYVAVQVGGCCTGAILANLMFELPAWQASMHVRTGPAQWLAESVATFGLLLVVLGHRRSEDAPWMVAAWIGAAYWFTASTSFANPAITIARSLTNTFAGIRAADAPGFTVAQFIGAITALALAASCFRRRRDQRQPPPPGRRSRSPRDERNDPRMSAEIGLVSSAETMAPRLAGRLERLLQTAYGPLVTGVQIAGWGASQAEFGAPITPPAAGLPPVRGGLSMTAEDRPLQQRFP